MYKGNEQMSRSRQGVSRTKNRKNSKYCGVIRSGNRWVAAVGKTSRGPAKYLGSFDTEVEAALAWNEETLKRWGPDAKFNDVSGETVTHQIETRLTTKKMEDVLTAAKARQLMFDPGLFFLDKLQGLIESNARTGHTTLRVDVSDIGDYGVKSLISYLAVLGYGTRHHDSAHQLSIAWGKTAEL